MSTGDVSLLEAVFINDPVTTISSITSSWANVNWDRNKEAINKENLYYLLIKISIYSPKSYQLGVLIFNGL